MDDPVQFLSEVNSTNIGFNYGTSERQCKRHLTEDYLWARQEAAIICFTSDLETRDELLKHNMNFQVA